MGGSIPLAGTGGGSNPAHASDVVIANWSDYNHSKTLHITANLGNPASTSQIAYTVEMAAQGGGNTAFGNDRGGHTGAIVGCPAPQFFRVEEYAT
jgi:hypothetical protein